MARTDISHGNTGIAPGSRTAPAPSAFKKRVKRRVSARVHDFFAVCPPGLKTTCKNELNTLDHDIKAIEPITGGVAFQSKLSTACLANLSLGSPKKNQTDRLGTFSARKYKS